MHEFETLQVHAGYEEVEPTSKARAVPISTDGAYAFDGMEPPAHLMALAQYGALSLDIANPTLDVLEKRIATLEGGTAGLAVASGHAAEYLAITTLARAGDNVVVSPYRDVASRNLFDVTLPDRGIEIRVAGAEATPEAFASRIDDDTRAVYLDALATPALRLVDVDAIAAAAHERGVAVLVDNSAGMGGYLFRPIEHGADVVIHSATKWINGTGTGLGGVLVDAGTMDWGNGRYPLFTEPSRSYRELRYWQVFGSDGAYGNLAFAMRARAEGLRDVGAALAPFNAWLHLLGMETLSLRANRMVENAQAIAAWLQQQEGITDVQHPDLPAHPDHALASRLFPRGAGTVVTFAMEGGAEAATGFLGQLGVRVDPEHVGHTRTRVAHLASTTHAALDHDQQAAEGVGPGTLRISCGIERTRMLLDELEAALERAR